MNYDALIVGGGPAGLSAALALGRQRKRVLLCDSGPRRNEAAVHLHNFVTRDGIEPREFRRIARAELAQYPSVELREEPVLSLTGERGDFSVRLPNETISVRRVLLCVGMVDLPLEIPGYRELWGRSIFQCPYCHGWELRDRPWGFLVDAKHLELALPFALQLRGLTERLAVFSNGAPVPAEIRSALEAANISVRPEPIEALAPGKDGLEAVSLAGGERVRCEVLFSHPPQRQVALVQSLELPLDEHGFVQVDPMTRQTGRPGIYAAGDLTTRMQGAVFAASAGTHAAAMLNVDLMMDAHARGALR